MKKSWILKTLLPAIAIGIYSTMSIILEDKLQREQIAEEVERQLKARENNG